SLCLCFVVLSILERHDRHLLQDSFPTRRSSDLPPDRLLRPRDQPEHTQRVDEAALEQRRRRIDRDTRLRHPPVDPRRRIPDERIDRKSTRLNSSHVKNSYAVFCLKIQITSFELV